MKMAARELLRRPRSFAVPAGILVLLALLLLYPSAILDGLNDSTTGALRTAPADLIVYAEDAKSSLLRSRIDAATRAQVEQVAGVAEASSFDVILLGALKSGGGKAIGLAVMTSERPIGPDLPAPGTAYVDASLSESAGVNEGDELLVGPLSIPVKVVGFTHDTNLFFQAGMVVDRQTWRQAIGLQAPEVDPAADPSSIPAVPGPLGDPASLPPASTATSSATSTTSTAAGTTVPAAPGEAAGGSPEAVEPDGQTAQALFLSVAPGADPATVAAAVDRATGGTTDTITPAEAVASLPGMSQQSTTFGYIRGVTLGVALVVVGLFLSFVTLERTPLYAVLKALGMSSRQLFTGVVIQVLLVTVTAAGVAAVATWGLTHVPLELPTSMRPVRFVETVVALGVTSVVGSVLSLRRVVRVDPASAIG
jgi:putative ABC transport system permease protein